MLARWDETPPPLLVGGDLVERGVGFEPHAALGAGDDVAVADGDPEQRVPAAGAGASGTDDQAETAKKELILQ
ncbi:hypothetical protein JYT82_00725 [bacterium AH-315-K20]|nr:hypothetical protein [bacterium AH-315-K20]